MMLSKFRFRFDSIIYVKNRLFSAIMLVGLCSCPALAAEGTSKLQNHLLPVFSRLSGSESLSSSTKESHTKYPIVLAHGLFGTDVYFDILEYFFNVPEYLRSMGYEVYVTKVPASSPVPIRAQVLAKQIDDILKKTGAKKVNLIGHSMGGLDIRFLVSSLKYGDRVASVTAIASPHQGTIIADVIEGKILPHLTQQMRGIALKLISFISQYEVDEKTMLTTMHQLTCDYMQNVFNSQNPNDPNVFYQSYGGVSNALGTGKDNDRVHPLFLIPYYVLREQEGVNDGLVGYESSKIPGSTVDHRIPADHFDQVGQPAHFFPSSKFDHKRFFARVVRDLAARGF